MPLIQLPLLSAFGLNIRPADGALAYFYEAGTSTSKQTYFSNIESEETKNPWPVVADGRGVFPRIYLTGTYKLILKNKNGITSYTLDDLQTPGESINYQGDFDSSTNSGDFPDSGEVGDLYRCTEQFNLNPDSGGRTLEIGDFIISNRSGATGIDADWNLLKGANHNDKISPIGSIIGIHPDVDTAEVINSSFWKACNGTGTFKFTYPDGSQSGDINTPQLTDSRFLMGGTAAGTGGSNVMLDHVHGSPSNHTHQIDPPSTTTSEVSFSGNTTIADPSPYEWVAPAQSALYSTGSHTHTVNIAAFTSGNNTSFTIGTGSVPGSTNNRPLYFTVKYYIRIK
jgi:hypothetical protein